MTRQLHLLLCCLCLLPIFSAAAAAQSIRWNSVAPPGVAATEYLTDDIVITPNGRLHAVAYLLDVNKNSILLTSTDRGETWSVRPIGANPSGMWLYSLAFTSDNVGYASGFSDGCGGCPVIMKTTDGGDSWNPTTFSGSGAINNVTFLDAKKGFAAGGEGLLKTTDAGATWKPIDAPALADVTPSEVTFPTATVGYASAIPAGGQGWPTVLLKSTDGGTTWAKIQDNGTNVNALAFRQLHFFGADTGVAVGRINSKPMTFRTVDGGKTWTNHYTPDVTMSSPYKALHAVHFLDKKIGIAAGDYGLILRTTDGGITWKREANSINSSNDFNSALVFSEQEATVGGAHGMLLNRQATFLPTVATSGTGLDFGTVTSGSKEMSLTISAANEAGVTISALQIQDGSGGPKGFTLIAPTTPPPYNLTPATPLTVTVRYTPQSGATGNITSTLYLATNDAARPQINLLLRAKGSASQAAAATLSATELDFGEVGPSTTAKRTVSITASGGAPLQVKGISVESLTGQEGFTALAERTLPTSLAPGESLKITVAFTPEDFQAPTQATLSVETNAGETPHNVFLQGQGTYPVVSLSSNALDFGTVDEGKEQTRPLSVAATNGAEVRIDSFYIQADGGKDAPEFAVIEPTSGFPIHIQKDAPLNVVVRFRPGVRNGEIKATLFAKTNLPLQFITVNLAGVAKLSTSSIQELPMAAASISISTSPSPLRRTGAVQLTLPEAGNVRVVIYDLLGKPVAELFNGAMNAGVTKLPFDATGLASGRYFCIAEGDGMRGFTEIYLAQ